ncbi:hypothetical protein FACS1894184_04200 [Clostridia bacterium]|nr:hypothetical protein FACS1894184_04200 [Clostridia bacterium]
MPGAGVTARLTGGAFVTLMSGTFCRIVTGRPTTFDMGLFTAAQAPLTINSRHNPDIATIRERCDAVRLALSLLFIAIGLAIIGALLPDTAAAAVNTAVLVLNAGLAGIADFVDLAGLAGLAGLVGLGENISSVSGPRRRVGFAFIEVVEDDADVADDADGADVAE